MARKVFKLVSDSEPDYLISAIISSSSDFKLCFELNNQLGFEFIRCDDIELNAGRPGSATFHSYFRCFGEHAEVFHFLSNRDNNRTGFYIPELKEVDYFFLVSDYPSRFDFDDQLTRIKELELVAGVYTIDPSRFKSAEAFRIFLET